MANTGFMLKIMMPSESESIESPKKNNIGFKLAIKLLIKSNLFSF
jgi:hypothetical protein